MSPDHALPAPTLAWITHLQLPADQKITVRANWVAYGQKASVYDDLADERILVHARTLTDPADAVHTVRALDTAATLYGQLAADLAHAAGAQGAAGRHARAREDALHTLDSLARTQLANPDDTWQDTAYRLLRDRADRLAEEAGDSALVGRVVHGRFLCTNTAQSRFRAALRTTIRGR